jgi:hypothetical protein
MLVSLALGAAFVVLTFFVHAIGLAVLALPLSDNNDARGGWGAYVRQVAAMLALVLGLFLLIMLEVAGWAVAFVLLDFFPDFESSLYFSTSTFATVGFNDLAPEHDWRLLAAIEGIAGFLIIGWSGAFLVSVAVRVGPFKKGLHF